MALRVVHVAEGYGGGLADAIASYAKSLPDAEHHLVHSPRRGVPLSAGNLAGYASTCLMGPEAFSSIATVRRRVNELRPNIVHLHSSYGGVYGRLALFGVKVPIVFTPHCFGFQREDIPKGARWFYRAVEFGLARRVDVFAGCSPHEIELAESFGPRVCAVFVPNVARIEIDEAYAAAIPAPATLRIVTAGRVVAQKDPELFAAIARAFVSDEHVEFEWVGGGDRELEKSLLDSGVTLAGWLDKAQVLARVRAADLYVHTGRWEGFPVGLLEALALDVPSLVISRPYSRWLPPNMLVSSVNDAVARVAELVASPAARNDLLNEGKRALAENTEYAQAQALRAAYELAIKSAA